MTNKFVFHQLDDETLEISLNGKVIGYADHDMHGWSGIELLENTVKRIAEVLDIPMEEKYG